jgi:hypothetical protein
VIRFFFLRPFRATGKKCAFVRRALPDAMLLKGVALSRIPNNCASFVISSSSDLGFVRKQTIHQRKNKHIPSLTGRSFVTDSVFYRHSVPDGTWSLHCPSRQGRNVNKCPVYFCTMPKKIVLKHYSKLLNPFGILQSTPKSRSTVSNYFVVPESRRDLIS